MRRWRFIKEKTRQRLPTYQGEAITSIIGIERPQEEGGVQPESSIPGKDVTTSDRNKTLTPTISYTTGVA